jgi:hypothetical protein
MTNEIAVNQTAADVFAAFAKRHVPPNYGLIARFNKGIWHVAGEEVKPCTLFVAQMAEAQFVCTRWMNSKPTARHVAYVRDGADFPERSTLGDTDPTKWERGRDSKPKDPWSMEMCLPLIRVEDDALCCFFTSSQGGKSAIAGLSEQYAKRIAVGQFGLPIIDLQGGHYDHLQYGRTLIPVLAVDSWQESGLPPPAPRIGAAPVVTQVNTQPAALEAPPGKSTDRMDDEIPF